MLFDAGELDALQQRIWQFFCCCVGCTLLVIGVLLAEICITNAVGVFLSIMKLFTYLQQFTKNVLSSGLSLDKSSFRGMGAENIITLWDSTGGCIH